MHLVAEFVVVVASNTCIVNIIKNRGVGYACKERISSTYRRLQCNVSIDIMLFKREVAVVYVLSYCCKVIANV